MKLPNHKSMLLAGCSFAAAAVLATPVYAQETSAGDNVIVVTAQNRAQDVQDVPIAMDVIGSAELANAGFNNANDLNEIAPAVQINQDSGTVKITVRGVGTNSNDEAQDTSVVANIDGEYINRPDVLSVAIFDLERVEVLRGPQGTLYGRNSTGGAINFITRKPSLDFGVDGSVSYGNYNDVLVNAGVDVPIGDTAGVRLSGFFNDRDGYIKHPAVPAFFVFPAFDGGRSNDNRAYGGRASFLIDDSDNNFTVNLSAEYAKREFTPQAYATANFNSGIGPTGPGCNANGFVQVAPNFGPNVTLCTPQNTNFLETTNRAEYAAPAFGLGRVIQDTWALRGRFAYEFSPEATLTYIGGYRSFSGDPDSYLTLPIIYQSRSFKNEADTQSHELRLNGDIGGIVYQVGAFYFKETLDRESGFFLRPVGPGSPFAHQGTYLSYFGRAVDSDSSSVFGQVDVPFGDTLTAVGGLRYTDNSRTAIYKNGTPFGAGPPDAFLNPAADPANFLFGSGIGRKNIDNLPYLVTLPLGSTDDKVTWLLGLNYTPNADTLIFAKVSTGFKGGGFDAVGTYAPESNTAYEVGGKFNFGSSGQHQLNLGAFYYDYKDLQVSVLLDTAVGGQTFNAGAATIWGLEADAQFEVFESGTFSISVNYLNAQYDELLGQFNVFCVDKNAANGVDDCNGVNGIGDLDPNVSGIQQPNFSGNTPPFSPEFVINIGYSHEFDLGGSGTLVAGVSSQYKSAYFTDFYNYNDSRQKGYTNTDLTLQWMPASEMFSVLLFARNLENERPLTYGSFVSAGPDDIYNWGFGNPRTYGVRVSFEY